MSPRLVAVVAALLLVTAVIAYAAGRSSAREAGADGGNGSGSDARRSGVPAAVRDRLGKGLNLSFWFSYRGDPTIDPKLWQPDHADLRRIAGLGFRHVRIPVDVSFLADARDPAAVDTTHLAELRAALDELQRDGLLAVIAFTGPQDWKNRLATDAATLEATAAIWQATAKAFADLPVDTVMFEALNEPGFDDTAASQRVMQRLHDAIRKAAPKHVIAVAGPKFSSVPELLLIQPLADANVVYTFHFYEPFNFTHQGATWGWPLWAKFKGWPYPSSAEAVAPLLAGVDDEVRPHLKFFGDQAWDRDKVALPLQQAADWAGSHGVTIWCGEFGALKTYAPPGSRDRWLRDAREAMEARGILWTHFDYLNHFGIAEGPQGARVYDQGALSALGLATK